MRQACRLLLISGSLREGSTNTALLRTAQAMAPDDVVPTLYEGLQLLPHFNPDDDADPLPSPVVDLRARIAGSDIVLFSTPEYAGALPGSFKNLLDWTVGGIELYRKPVAWVNASASPTNAARAHDSLRKVLGYIGSEPTSLKRPASTSPYREAPSIPAAWSRMGRSEPRWPPCSGRSPITWPDKVTTRGRPPERSPRRHTEAWAMLETLPAMELLRR